MQNPEDADIVRARCTTYECDGEDIVVIQDPDNYRAWIESNVSCRVDP